MIVEKLYKSGGAVNRVCDDCGRHDLIKRVHKKQLNTSLCRGCSNKMDIDTIHNVIKQNGFIWLSGYYKNNRSILSIECSCGETFERCLHQIIRCKYGCEKCELKALSEKLSGGNNPMAGKFGKLNPAYNDGLSAERRIARRYDKNIQKWAKEIKEIANYVCDCCTMVGNGSNLESHHLYNYISNVELSTDKSNGVCLCVECHKGFHKLYGKVNNTPEQYITFKEVYNGNKE